MTWIKTVPESEATGETAEAFTRVRPLNGSKSNIAAAASINPRVMVALAELLQALRGTHSALGKRRQEMIAVLTSASHRCQC